ncbi:MAG: hypothetical protein U5Q03_19000 [Bacteroidota bacterium]|nr:hypothetical protein [Bacteroidota bacterium]
MKQCKTIIIFFFFFSSLLASGQIGIMTSTPDNSAELDVYAIDKGLLIPRVSLSGDITSPAPVNSPAVGLLVYNTAASQPQGFYYWKDGRWNLIKSPSANDVSGPASSLDNSIVRFNGTGGQNIQASVVLIDDNGNLLDVNNLNVGGFSMPGGAQQGEILVSDAGGNASWESAPPVDIEEDNVIVVNNANTLNFANGIGVSDDGNYHATVTIYNNTVTRDVIQLSSSDSINLNVFTDPVAIPWDIEEMKDPGTFVHSTSQNPARVQVNTHGIYEFNYMFSHLNKTVKRQTIRCRMRINGNYYVPHVASYSFSYQTYENKVSNISSSFLVEMNAGDYVEVVTNGQTETGLSNLIPIENVFFMRLIREL